MNDDEMTFWVFDFYENFICYSGYFKLNCYIGKKSARLGTFRCFGTERARLGTFRGLGTERARLSTSKNFEQLFFSSDFFRFFIKKSIFLKNILSKPLKVPSLARFVSKPLKVPSLARSVPKPRVGQAAGLQTCHHHRC